MNDEDWDVYKEIVSIIHSLMANSMLIGLDPSLNVE